MEEKNKDLKDKNRKKKDIKITIVIIIIYLVIISLLVFSNNREKEDDYYGIFNYLEKKYNEDFEFYDVYIADFTVYALLVTSESFPDIPFVVTVKYRWKKEHRVYNDNYIEVKEFGKTYKFLKNIANNSFKDVNVFYRHKFLDSSNNSISNIPLEMYFRGKSFLINYWVEIKSSDEISKDHIEKFAKLLESINSKFYMVIVTVDDKNYSNQDFNFLKQTVTDKRYINYVEILKPENEKIMFFWNDENVNID